MPDETSIYCKNRKSCGVYNIDEPYCIDCAIEELLKAKIEPKIIEEVIKILYGEKEWAYSWTAKSLKKLTPPVK